MRHAGGTTFLDPVGHVQIDGDYRESWQPAGLSVAALAASQDVAQKVTDARAVLRLPVGDVLRLGGTEEPVAAGHRRVAVTLARGADVEITISAASRATS